MTPQEKHNYLRTHGSLCVTCANKEICIHYKQFNSRRVEYWYNHGIHFKVDQCLNYKEKEAN